MTEIDILALPFDQYQRYTAVAQIADRVRAHLALPRLRVLDVGGFFRTRHGEASLPASLFLPQDRIVAVDLVVEPLPGYVLSRGQALPFGDRVFDLVVTCDTLEHVPPAGRPAFVDELLRVAGCYLVLIAPFDSPSTRLAERIVYEHLVSQGYQHAQLREHLDHGLPDADALRAGLAERDLAFFDFADGYIHHWLLMMLIKNTPGQSLGFHLDLDRYYNRHFSPGDRREPAYRRVFVVAQPGHEALLPTIAGSFRPAEAASAPPAFGLLTGMFSVLNQGQMAAQAKAQYEAQGRQAEVQAQLAALKTEKTRLRELVAGYERGRFIRFMRRLHSWRAKLGLD